MAKVGYDEFRIRSLKASEAVRCLADGKTFIKMQPKRMYKDKNEVETEADQEEKDAETYKEEIEVETEVDKEENAESDQEDEEVETKPEIEGKLHANKSKTVRKMKSTRNLRKRKKVKQTNQLWQVAKKRMQKGKKSAMTDPSNRRSKERLIKKREKLQAYRETRKVAGFNG
ncbi:hypothetical protein Tco_0891005 [Tanacetum coccineum]|uniref:Uncharacterized protein n=1 Tax=Tanacetum coccineum TaxID=301880 RepID=A0ABQ5C381_9ASTR